MVGMVLLQRFVFNNLKQWTFVDHRLVDATPHHPAHAHFKLKKKKPICIIFLQFDQLNTQTRQDNMSSPKGELHSSWTAHYEQTPGQGNRRIRVT